MSTVAPPPDSPEFAAWLRRTMTREDFEALPPDDVEALKRFAVREALPPRTTLFRHGQTPEAIFIIEEGEVELLHETGSGRLIVTVVREGSSIGDLPWMLETPYPHTAITRTPTTVLRFSLATVRTLIEIYPHICFRWLRLVSRRLDGAHRRLVELAGRSAVEQLARFLLHEVEERGSPRLAITQRELAETLGLSRQTVSRVLRELDDLGLVGRGRGELRIRRHELLRQRVMR